MQQTIDAQMLYSMLAFGVKALEERKDYINDLNVFPVPDGDTGTNMLLTLNAAMEALAQKEKFTDVYELLQTAAMSASRGARGNSGSIFSQLLVGFARGIEGCASIGKKEIASGACLADIQARKAVSSPKEGTILTVARDISRKAGELCDSGITMEAFLKELVVQAELTLSRTPEMLPVLKEAGVVDSGGQGLVDFLKGAYEAFAGSPAEYDPEEYKVHRVSFSQRVCVDSSDIETSLIKYTYCTEFIINIEQKLSLENRVVLKRYFEELGDSLVFVCTDEFVKIHVHTNHPGLAFEKGLEYGSLTGIKVDNMKEEHSEKLETEKSLKYEKSDRIAREGACADKAAEYGGGQRESLKEYGFVSVCAGEGIKELFASMSVDAVVEGGQTMNPSVDDIAGAICSVNAKSVFVLPNNSNVILTAAQAAQFCPDTDVKVIPTKNIAEGISAVINYLPALSIEENAAHMEEAIAAIKTVQVTWAVRDCEMDGFAISKGQYMALYENSVIASSGNLEECTKNALDAMKRQAGENTGVVSIYYGEGADEELAAKIEQKAESIWEDADVDVLCTGQPVYAFIISLEE